MVTPEWRYHPPPGWPVPPDGWVPPPDWIPDSRWPPAPADWKFWVPVELVSVPPPLPPPPPADLVPPPPRRPGRRARRPVPRTAALVGAAVLVSAVVAVLTSSDPPPETVHEVFAARYGQINAMAVARLDGAPVVIVQVWYGSDLQVLDLATGERLLTIPWEHPAYSIATGDLSGTPIAVVSGWFSDAVRVFDLTTGEPLRELASDIGIVESVAVGALAGTPVAVGTSDNRDRGILIWVLATGKLLVEPFGDLAGWDDGRALALAEVDGRDLVVAGDEGGLEVWDITDPGRPVWERRLSDMHTADLDIPQTVVIDELDGRPVAIAGSGSGSALVADQVTMWDLTTGYRVGRLSLPGRHGAPTAIAVSELDDRPVAVVSYQNARTVLWDLRSQEPIWEPVDHLGEITQLAITQLDGEAVVVSSSQDGRVLRWPLKPFLEDGA